MVFTGYYIKRQTFFNKDVSYLNNKNMYQS